VDRMVQDSQRLESLYETRAMDSSTHKQCRFEEGVACAHSRRCEEELEEAWRRVEYEEEVMKGIHWRIDDEWCEDNRPTDTIFPVDPNNWAQTSPYPHLDFTQPELDHRRVTVHEFHLYVRQKPIVHAAWIVYNAKIIECANYESTLENRVAECDSANVQSEQSACAHAEEDRSVRNDFGHAWIHVNESYNDAVEEVMKLEEDRKHEWETLHIVTCLLLAIHSRVDHAIEVGEPCITETSNPEETTYTITHCHELAHNLTDHLNIDYGNPPPPPPIPDPPSYPCTPEFIEEEYAGFPELLRNTYTGEISGLESYQTVASPYGWPGCAAPRICHPCAGMALVPPNPLALDGAQTCKLQEEYLLPGQTDVDSMRCLDGTCVPITSRCNGEPNCADGSDEMNCEAGILVHLEAATECQDSASAITFHCGATNEPASCVSLPGARCNGYSNCADGSDEQDCLCGSLNSVSAEATSGRTITVERSLSMTTGVFHDRSYTFDSLGTFAGMMFIKTSNDDKDTDHDHVMWKIRTPDPVRVYLVKLSHQVLPWLFRDGWALAAGKAGLAYSGTRGTKDKDWEARTQADGSHLEYQLRTDHYGPGEVYMKEFAAGTVIIPGNGGNDGSFLIFLEKPCHQEIETDEVVAPTHYLAVVSWPAHAWNSFDETERGGSMTKCFPANTVQDIDGDGYMFTSCCAWDGSGMDRDCSATAARRTTHRDAVLQCQHQHGRMCTAEEAIAGAIVSRGCSVDGPRAATGNDLNRAWTSTACTVEESEILTKGNDPTRHVGVADVASSLQFIDIGAGAFDADGEILGVSFSVDRPSQIGNRFQIYRPVSGNQFELVAESGFIHAATAGVTVTKTFAVPIPFMAGDYIGWAHMGQGTMPFSPSDNTVRWKYGIEEMTETVDFDAEGGRTYAYEVMYASNVAGSADTDSVGDSVTFTMGHDPASHSGTPDGSSAIQFIDLGAGAFENAGEMTGVHFAVARANQAGNKFQIYRPVSGDQYELVAESEPLASPEVGVTVSETFASPLAFSAGDYVGWVHDGQGTIPYTSHGSDNMVRFKYGIEGVGETVDFNEGGNRTYAYEVICH